MAGLDGVENKIHPGEAATKDLYHLPPEEDAKIPTVCHSLDQALDYLDKDRAFLTKGGVFTDAYIDAYIDLKMQEVTRFRMATHPVEFDMYYSAASSSPENKVASEEQKARDTDARRILEAELRKEEAALESLKKDFNNGQPERRGDERNYQKYLDRVNEMKAALTRKEADVASLRRELSKFGGGGAK
jgi:hypothetical protein